MPPRADGIRSGIDPADPDRAGIRLEEAEDQVDRRGLARPVRAEQCEDLAVAEAQVEATQCRPAPEALDRAADRQNWRVGGRNGRAHQNRTVIVPVKRRGAPG